MTQEEFRAFVASIKAIVPFEATNCVAHLVLEDYNFRDSDIEFQLKWIEDKSYEPMLSEYQFDIASEHYVEFIRGVLRLMLTIPEDIRDSYHEDEE